MSETSWEIELLRDDCRYLRERLTAAEKVIEAARLVADEYPAPCEKGCAFCGLVDAIDAYDERTAR